MSAQSVLAFIIRTLKEGNGDRETISSLKEMKETLAAVGIVIGTFTAAWLAVNKILDETVGVFNTYATGVENFSASLSTSAEQASRLIQVGDQLGISSDQMQTDLFRAVKNGMVPTIDGLAAMADQYNALATPQERATFLQKNFGRSSEDLARLLAEGSAGILALNNSVQAGLVMDEAAIANSETYKRAVDRFSEALKASNVAIGESNAREVEHSGIIGLLTTILQKDTDQQVLLNTAQELGINATRSVSPLLVEVGNHLITYAQLLELVNEKTHSATPTTIDLNQQLAGEAKSSANLSIILGSLATDIRVNTAYENAYNDTMAKTGDTTQASAAAMKAATDESTFLAQQIADTNTQLENEAQAVEDVAKAAVKFGIEAPLSAEFASEDTQLADLNTQLQSAVLWYGKNSTQVQTLVGQIDDLKKATDKQIASMIYQQVAAGLDAKGQADLAHKLGLMSDADYDVALAIAAQQDAYANDKNQADYLQNLGLINDAVDYARANNIPITQEFILKFIEEHTVFTNYAQQNGPVNGHWIPGPGGEPIWVPNTGGSSGNSAGGGVSMSSLTSAMPTSMEMVSFSSAGWGSPQNNDAALLAAIDALPDKIANKITQKLPSRLGQVTASAVRDTLQYNKKGP